MTKDESSIVIDAITGQTSVPWIYSGGDAAYSGKSQSVIEAVAAGERAAVAMDEYMTGENMHFGVKNIRLILISIPIADPVMYPRAKT